jgi:hypothetical protein
MAAKTGDREQEERRVSQPGAEVEIKTICALPLKHEMTTQTRINFTMLPSKGIKAISILHSMNRLIKDIQATDPKAHLDNLAKA